MFIKIATGMDICSASNLNRTEVIVTGTFLRLKKPHYLFNFVYISGTHNHTSWIFCWTVLQVSGELVVGSCDGIRIIKTNIYEKNAK